MPCDPNSKTHANRSMKLPQIFYLREKLPFSATVNRAFTTIVITPDTLASERDFGCTNCESCFRFGLHFLTKIRGRQQKESTSSFNASNVSKTMASVTSRTSLFAN